MSFPAFRRGRWARRLGFRTATRSPANGGWPGRQPLKEVPSSVPLILSWRARRFAGRADDDAARAVDAEWKQICIYVSAPECDPAHHVGGGRVQLSLQPHHWALLRLQIFESGARRGRELGIMPVSR